MDPEHFLVVHLDPSGVSGCTTLDAMCHDFYEEPFMWYLIKRLLKVQVDEVYCFVITRVVGVNDTSKEVKQAC